MKNIGLANTNVRCADDYDETQAACGGNYLSSLKICLPGMDGIT